MQIKATLRYHWTSIKWLPLKRCKVSNLMRKLLCIADASIKMAQPLWKRVVVLGQFLIKVNIPLPSKAEILLLGNIPKSYECICSEKSWYTNVWISFIYNNPKLKTRLPNSNISTQRGTT